MFNFRTDPLDLNGNVDSYFFASIDYDIEQKKLISYLKQEGFFEKEVEYFIDFNGRKWHVYPIQNKNKKKG
jgi:hypothetical protein